MPALLGQASARSLSRSGRRIFPSLPAGLTSPLSGLRTVLQISLIFLTSQRPFRLLRDPPSHTWPLPRGGRDPGGCQSLVSKGTSQSQPCHQSREAALPCGNHPRARGSGTDHQRATGPSPATPPTSQPHCRFRHPARLWLCLPLQSHSPLGLSQSSRRSPRPRPPQPPTAAGVTPRTCHVSQGPCPAASA